MKKKNGYKGELMKKEKKRMEVGRCGSLPKPSFQIFFFS